MQILFLDRTDLENSLRNKHPDIKSCNSTEKYNTIEDHIDQLRHGKYGLANFADQKEEEDFLKEMSLQTDVAIIFEWKDFLKSYLFWSDPKIQPKVYLKVGDQYRALYDNGAQHDYNRFKKWIKWLPAGYYHTTKLGGGPPPQSIGAGLENLGKALGIDVEWHLSGNRLFFWRKGETCAKKIAFGGTCEGCAEDIRDICLTSNRHTY